MKTFYSAQDIEDLAARGQRQLVVDESVVLTDLARHAAEQLGVALVYPGQSPTRAAAPAPSSPVPPPAPAARVGRKPKGCQHGPLSSEHATPVNISSNQNSVVDQLVGLVKRFGNKGSQG